MQTGSWRFGAALLTLSCMPALAQDLSAQDGQARYQLERIETGFIRLDRQTGAVSYCREESGGLTCRLAADERTAFEQELDMLAKRVEALEKRLDGRNTERSLPGDEEVEEALSIMERFMRRFMAIIGELTPDGAPVPDRT